MDSTSDVLPWKSFDNREYDYSTCGSYSHNTYHGVTRHYRPMLTGSQLMILSPDDIKSSRYVDGFHHYNLTPNLSSRRKSSSASNDGSDLYAPYERTATIYIPGDYQASQSEIGRLLPKQDLNNRTESFYQHAQYLDNTYGHSSEFSANTPLYGYSTDYAYDNMSSVSNGARTSQKLSTHSHRRTSSNISSGSFTGGTNPNFCLEDECVYTPTHYSRRQAIECDYTSNFTRQDSFDSNFDPSLESIGCTRLRSSLKRNYHLQAEGKACTNHTPPDSLTSDDSSYVSAKDSNSSANRVRFSPTTLIDLPVPGQNQDTTIPLQARQARQRSTVVDMDREFLT